jgi:hypothetical protein
LVEEVIEDRSIFRRKRLLEAAHRRDFVLNDDAP